MDISSAAPRVPYRRTGTPQVTSGVFTYNADVVVTGFDALFNFDITDSWDAGLSVSYADGEYDDALVPCRDSNFDGVPDANPLPGATAANPLGTGPAWDAAGGPGGPALCASSDSATRAPPWNASLRSQFEFPVFAGTTGFVRGLYTYYAENDNADAGSELRRRRVRHPQSLHRVAQRRSPLGSLSVRQERPGGRHVAELL